MAVLWPLDPSHLKNSFGKTLWLRSHSTCMHKINVSWYVSITSEILISHNLWIYQAENSDHCYNYLNKRFHNKSRWSLLESPGRKAQSRHLDLGADLGRFHVASSRRRASTSTSGSVNYCLGGHGPSTSSQTTSPSTPYLWWRRPSGSQQNIFNALLALSRRYFQMSVLISFERKHKGG